jgi:Cupin domain
VPPGGGPPPHRHDFEEMFTLIDGEIEFTFRGETSTISPCRRPLAGLAEDEERGLHGGEAGGRGGRRAMTHREHLAQADRFIAECKNRIARQREIIALSAWVYGSHQMVR